MSKKWILIFPVIVGMSLWTGDIQAENPIGRAGQAVFAYAPRITQGISEQLLRSLDINVDAIKDTSAQMKLIVDKIRREVGLLQGAVNLPQGPINQIRKVVTAAAELKAALSAESKGRFFSVIPRAEYLIFEIDRLEFYSLLKPSKQLLFLFKQLFELALKMRERAGQLGRTIISQDVAVLVSKGVNVLGLLADNVGNLIAGGKRNLKLVQGQLINRLIQDRHRLPELEAKLTELEGRIVPPIQLFKSSIASIGLAIIALAATANNLPADLANVRAIMGIKNLMVPLRADLYTLLGGTHDALASLTEIIELIVINLINALDETIGFKLLKTKADRAAQQLPVNARSLKEIIWQLYQYLAPQEKEIEASDQETELPLFDFGW